MSPVAGAILVGTLCLIGCGPPAIKFPETVPFSGKVTLDGTALANVAVVFTPASGRGTSAMGVTDAEGKYELGVTFGAERKSGAVPDDYKVHISSMLPPPPADKKAEKPVLAATLEKVPAQYSTLARTILKAKVDAKGGSQDFELKSK